MSRRYMMARLGATLEQVPELNDRLAALGERFERVRVREGESVELTRAGEVFDRLYGDAALALSQAGDRPPPSELIALEEMVRRAEGALDTYSRLANQGEPSTDTTRRRRDSGGHGVILLAGVLLFGGVMFLASRD